IKLTREDDGCGFQVDYSAYKRARFYIVKEENSWRLNYHSVQSIRGIYHFGALTLNDASCGFSYVGEAVKSLKTMNAPIREFLATYRFNSGTNLYEVKVSADELESLKNSNIMVANFERRGRCCLGEELETPNPLPIVAPEPIAPDAIFQEEELVFCDFTFVPPVSPFEEDKMEVFLNENDNPLSQEGISGRVYIQIYLNEQGVVYDTEIKRGLHPVIDQLLLKKVLGMPAWTPALNNRNQGCKCKMMLPFRVEL
ncbi:MAG: hypothetical protein NWS86_04700, partial [Flavobacteriales bacterium]|nr:hypothetical protein [Flavobacteriales bacterium]